MSANLRVRVGLMAMGLVAVAGCLIESEDFAGKPCGRDLDCPESYRCAPRPTGRVCELIFPVERDSGVQDAGPPLPPRFYCSDVKPVLDYFCVDCHGPTRREGGDFRLDYYELDGGLPGAHAMASNLKYRVALAQTMPPLDSGLSLSDTERAQFFLWADAGAPFCDAGVPAADGGSSDGGRDGGGVDGGGVDAGYYQSQIQPIFNTYCTPCHAWTYQLLVNVNANCNASYKRVAPFDAGGSMMYLKITNDPAKCGSSMPQNTAPLSTRDPVATQKIRDWIIGGADAN